MEPKLTPPEHHKNRSAYERFFQEDDVINLTMLALDLAIERLQHAIHNETDNIQDLAAQLRTVKDAVKRIVQTERFANWTDFSRLAVNTVFATERVIMPFLFMGNTKNLRDMRAKNIDGCLGLTVDGIDQYLAFYDVLSGENTTAANSLVEYVSEQLKEPHDDVIQALRTRKGNEAELQRLRGSILEQTIQALLNYNQDPDFIALTVSYYEDTQLGIDLRTYFIGKNGASYTQPVSIKTNSDDAEELKRKHPEYVVLCANNLGHRGSHLQVARLLVREQQGSPGITTYEKKILETARRNIRIEFNNQVSMILSEKIMPAPSRPILRQVNAINE